MGHPQILQHFRKRRGGGCHPILPSFSWKNKHIILLTKTLPHFANAKKPSPPLRPANNSCGASVSRPGHSPAVLKVRARPGSKCEHGRKVAMWWPSGNGVPSNSAGSPNLTAKSTSLTLAPGEHVCPIADKSPGPRLSLNRSQ